MKRIYKLKKGLDFALEGKAEPVLTEAPASAVYGVRPPDFPGIVPRLAVKAGDKVKAGDTLFVDKRTERVAVVSPVSGAVQNIVRGERRKILAIEIAADATQEYRTHDVAAIDGAAPDEVVDLLLASGLFALFRQRPYDVVPDPATKPRGIFISAFSKMPLAADFTFVAEGREDDFKAGVRLLARVAPVHVGISPRQVNTALLPIPEASVSIFDGPNPCGNVGVQISHVAPVCKGETVWTVAPEVVCFIGEFARTGRVQLRRRVAVAGSRIKEPRYVNVTMGARVADVVGDNLKPADTHTRIIDGNPLVGAPTEADAYLSAQATEICAIPEGDDRHELFGWIMPRLGDFSVNRSYFSWLLGKKRRYDLDCRIKGGERHMIMSGEYDRVLPMDIYGEYLIKAIITGDIDRQEALGIYEVAPEDFAVAEFVCSSKLELQRIVREGLDVLMKENA